MNAAPRPAARVLLASRYLVPRVSLLALPDGPVVGLDLTRGVPVTLELAPGREGRARSITASDLSIERPVVAAPESPPVGETPRPLAGVRHELGSRRARVTVLAGVVVAAVVVCSSLLGGSRGPSRAVASAPFVPLTSARAPAAAPRVARRARAHLRVVAPVPTSRGGPAHVLAVAPRVVPPPARPVAPGRRRERAPAAPSGWVEGLVVGS